MIVEELREWLRGFEKLVIACIGNPSLGDDGAGPLLAEKLRSKGLPKGVVVVNCGPSPENYVGKIAELCPSHVLFVDTVLLGERPGTVALLGVEDLRRYAPVSTHRLPLTLLVEYLRLSGFKGKVAVLGIEPKSLEFGEGLSREVEEAVEFLSSALREALRLGLLKG